MTLDAPAWLLLLPFVLIAGWRWPGLRFHEPLRALTLLLIVLAMCGPRSRWGDDGRDVWVLVDRSASNAESLQTSLAEWELLIARGKGRNDRLHFVDFAREAQVRGGAESVFQDDVSQTRFADAVHFTLNQMNPARPNRMLALTDGQSTQPYDGLAETLSRAGVSLDYRLSVSAVSTDYQISNLRIPNEVEPGASFLVEATINGNGKGPVSWELLRNDQPAGNGRLDITNGLARLRLSDHLGSPGVARYELRINATEDAHSQNNKAAAWVLAGGRNQILLVTAFEDDPIATILRSGGVAVHIATNPETLAAGHLNSVRTVIFHNVPAWRVSREFLAALDFFVRSQNGGLLMVGGRSSFAAGGYAQSAIDELLPVSMELRQDHRRLAVAMSIIMDRSGSMSASTGGGLAKMDLANAGAERAAQLLGDSDFISVHAVDSEAHEILPLVAVGRNRKMIARTVRRVTSMGGGIFVYHGLEAGWNELQNAEVGQRHLVLFSDAADSEEPGDYVNLIETMREGGATISVIALGTREDTDADLLVDIARRGGGRVFFSNEAAGLPALFAQETVTIARSAFIDEPVALVATPGWREFADRDIAWPSEVDGYNLGYLRPGATAAALSGDQYDAPLVAAWQRGTGRTAAVTFPLGGEYSETVRAWDAYADFVRTLTRWLAGDAVPPGIGLRTNLEGNELQLNLFVDETLSNESPSIIPLLAVTAQSASGASLEPKNILWEKVRPGEFVARAEIPPSAWMRGAIQVGAHTVPFGPFGSIDEAEWIQNLKRVEDLSAVSRQTGGVERLDLSEIWSAPHTRAGNNAQPWLLITALVLFLADALLMRLGLSLFRNLTAPALQRADTEPRAG